MRDEKISKKYWLSYVQGFHAWGAGQVVDGEVIEYDGVSGSHTLLFQVLDAFLGLESFTADNNRGHYIPFNQRRLCAALRKHSFRGSLGSNSTDVMIQEEIAKIIKLIRVSRKSQSLLFPFFIRLRKYLTLLLFRRLELAIIVGQCRILRNLHWSGSQ